MAIGEKRALKVFLCHASGDKPQVLVLYKHLVVEGVDAWLDQEKLLPGQDWRVEIPLAVQEADRLGIPVFDHVPNLKVSAKLMVKNIENAVFER